MHRWVGQLGGAGVELGGVGVELAGKQKTNAAVQLTRSAWKLIKQGQAVEPCCASCPAQPTYGRRGSQSHGAPVGTCARCRTQSRTVSPAHPPAAGRCSGRHLACRVRPPGCTARPPLPHRTPGLRAGVRRGEGLLSRLWVLHRVNAAAACPSTVNQALRKSAAAADNCTTPQQHNLSWWARVRW